MAGAAKLGDWSNRKFDLACKELFNYLRRSTNERALLSSGGRNARRTIHPSFYADKLGSGLRSSGRVFQPPWRAPPAGNRSQAFLIWDEVHYVC